MTYSLEFDQRALKEWHKLGDTIRQQLKKKLAEVLENPRIDANRLRELPDCYKVKLFVKRLFSVGCNKILKAFNKGFSCAR